MPSRRCSSAASSSASPSSNVSESRTVRLRLSSSAPAACGARRAAGRRAARRRSRARRRRSRRAACRLSPAASRRSSSARSRRARRPRRRARVRRLDRLGDLLRNVLEAGRQVVAVPARQCRLAADDLRDRAVAVPLHLELPARAARDVLGQRREHRRVPAGSGRPRCRRGLVPLAQDQPVLLVAARGAPESATTFPAGAPRAGAPSDRRSSSPRAARTCRDPRSPPCRRRTVPSGSRPRRSRTRAGGPRRAPQGAAGPARAARPSGRPSSPARRCARAGSRSATGARRGAARRRSAPSSCPAAWSRTARLSSSGRACACTR